MFGFLAQLVDPAVLPTYNGVETGYFEFVMIGVVIATVTGLLLQQVATAMRQEQMMGTLEALLVTPTSPTTVQVGSVAFDLVFIPIRIGAAAGRRRDHARARLPGQRHPAEPRPARRASCRSCGASACWPPRRSSRSAAARASSASVMSVLGLASGAVLPADAAARLAADAGRGQPGRDRDGGHARRADRRRRLGAPSLQDLIVLVPLSAAGAVRRHHGVPRRAVARAPARNAGALLTMWDRVDELARATRRTTRRCGCTGSSCWRRAAGARPGWTRREFIADERPRWRSTSWPRRRCSRACARRATARWCSSRAPRSRSTTARRGCGGSATSTS